LNFVTQFMSILNYNLSGHLDIYFRYQFWSNGLLRLAAAYIPAKFYASSSIGYLVIAFCVKFKMAVAAISFLLGSKM